MQEEIENRSVTLVINAAKLTGRLLKAAVRKYLAYRQKLKGEAKAEENAPPEKPIGKQTVKELIGQNQGVSNIEITDKNIKSFDKVARKYGVDYAIKKDRSCKPPKYLVFFKAKDADALTAAFKEYSGKKLKKRQRPSVILKLAHFRELVKNAAANRNKRREIGRE